MTGGSPMAASISATKESSVIAMCVALAAAMLLAACLAAGAWAGGPRPVVEIEEDVYTHQAADNGAGPM